MFGWRSFVGGLGAAAVLAVCGANAATAPAAGTTWNVTPTSTPSLTTVEQTAQPGDTIVLSGTWHNFSLVPKVSGTAAAPITYQAGPSGATFDGAGPSGVAVISRNYLVFNGITFANSNYVNAPVANKGVILRGNHITFQNNTFTHMQMQLIAADDNSILNNTWRCFVAIYDSSGRPETAGDMLAILSGSDRNEIAGNDMKYGGHSLIEVGTGWGPPNTANWIHDNILDNPWYKNLILADDGGGTIVENNQLLNANSVPTLQSTLPQSSLPIGWPKDGKAYASQAVQFSGSNFVFRNNTIDNAVSVYGAIGLGARWYYGAGAPAGGALVESDNDEIYGNTISNCKDAATFGFEQNYTPGTDDSVPTMTGDLIHDNTVVNAQPTPYSWDGTLHHETIILRSFKGAPIWAALNGNGFFDNTGVSSTNAYRRSYVNAAGGTTTNVYTLAQLEALDPANLYGNS